MCSCVKGSAQLSSGACFLKNAVMGKGIVRLCVSHMPNVNVLFHKLCVRGLSRK